MDVLAANAIAEALIPYYRPGENLVRAAFLDPLVGDMYGINHAEPDSRTAQALTLLAIQIAPGAVVRPSSSAG